MDGTKSTLPSKKHYKGYEKSTDVGFAVASSTGSHPGHVHESRGMSNTGVYLNNVIDQGKISASFRFIQ